MCIDRIISCNCDNIAPTDCSYGLMRDNTESPVCIGGTDGSCLLQSQCQNDTCGGIGTSICNCDFANCVFVSFGMNGSATTSDQSNTSMIMSTTGWEGCFSRSSDSLKILGNFPNAVITSQISSDDCNQNSTQSCDQNCMLVTMIRKAVSDSSKNQQATTKIAELQSELRNSIDNQTGYMLGRDFHASLVAIGVPPLRQDNSLEINLIIFFQQLGQVQQPTQDHLRVYYQTILALISDLGNFTTSDTNNWQYTWNSLANYSQMNFNQTQNGQNNQMNQGSSFDGNNYILTLTVPTQSVQQALTQSRRDGSGSGTGTVSWNNSAQSAHTPVMLLMSFVMAFLLCIL